MTVSELKEKLTQLGVNFSNSASKAELERLFTAASNGAENAEDAPAESGIAVINEELQKKLDEAEGFSFDSDEFKKKLAEAKEREYPDFGRDVPEGVYTFSGKGNTHAWVSPRTGNTSNILTAYVYDVESNLYEIALAAFAVREYPFVKFDGKDDRGKNRYKAVEANPMVPYTSSTADRNAAVAAIPVGTEIKVFHAKGHFDNPYQDKVFDFVYTWVEE